MTDSNYDVAEVYEGLRDQVLQLNAEAAGIEGVDSTTPFAVLMETGYPEAVATLLGVFDGTASLYFSNGGGIVGGGEHEPVRQAAQGFVRSAQEFVEQATPTDSFPLPQQGSVRFYLITPGGVHTVEAVEEDLGYERHAFSPLFYAGHALITAIRENTPESAPARG